MQRTFKIQPQVTNPKQVNILDLIQGKLNPQKKIIEF